MKNYPTYDSLNEDEKKKLKAAGLEAWMAEIFLRGLNQGVYSELMRDYRKDYANQDDNYPKSVRGMVDVMRQLKPKQKIIIRCQIKTGRARITHKMVTRMNHRSRRVVLRLQKSAGVVGSPVA